MSTHYDSHRVSHKMEVTPGTSLIVDEDSICYSLGVYNKASQPPGQQRPVYQDATPHDSRELDSLDDLWLGFAEKKGWFAFRAQNGIPAWLGLGASSTSDNDPAGGYYTHTLTPALELPSWTALYERTGPSATDWVTQFSGCKVDALTLAWHATELNKLMYRLDVFCKDQERVPYTLVNAPALPATINTDTYRKVLRTYDSVDIKGLQNLEIIVNNGLVSELVHGWDVGDDSYDGGVESVQENDAVRYTVKMDFHPSVIEFDMWDDHADGTGKTAVFTFIRDATYDYIKVTCLGCKIPDYPLTVPDPITRTFMDRVIMQPTQMSIEVVDQIPGGTYGE